MRDGWSLLAAWQVMEGGGNSFSFLQTEDDCEDYMCYASGGRGCLTTFKNLLRLIYINGISILYIDTETKNIHEM